MRIHKGKTTLIDQLSDPLDLLMWLDASTITTGAGAVPYWQDQSLYQTGSVIQSTGDNQPLLVEDAINGFPVVRFDGTDDFMTNHITRDDGADDSIAGTYVVVTKYDAAVFPTLGAQTLGIIGGITNGSANDGIKAVSETAGYSDTGQSTFYFNGTVAAAGTPPDGIDSYHSIVCTDTVIEHETGTSIGRVRSGSVYWGGDLAEALLFVGVLSDPDIAVVHAYLQGKYQLW